MGRSRPIACGRKRRLIPLRNQTRVRALFRTFAGSVRSLPVSPFIAPCDVAGDLFGGSQHEAVHGRDIAARHAEARVTEQRFDGQFAQAQFMRCAGVGMAKAVRRVGSADNSPPRLGKYRSVGPVSTAYAGKT